MGEKVGMASYSGILVAKKVSRIDVNQSRDGLRQSRRSSIPKLLASNTNRLWDVYHHINNHVIYVVTRGSRLTALPAHRMFSREQ